LEPENDEAAGLSLVEYWEILRRRRSIIILSTLVIGLIGMIATFLSKPVYQSVATLIVDPPATGINMNDTTNPLSRILTLSPSQDAATVTEVLQSPDIAEKIKKQFGNATVKVQQDQETNLIQVTAEANSPKYAAQAANTLLENYIDGEMNQSLTEIKAAKVFVGGQEKDAYRNLMTATAKLEMFKSQHHLSDLVQDRATLATQVADLSKGIQDKQTEIQSVGQQLAVQKTLLRNESEAQTLKAPITNPEIETVKSNLLSAQADRVAMTQKGGFTDRAPQVISVDARIAELKRQLAVLPPTIMTETSTPNPVQLSIRSKLSDLATEQAAAGKEYTSLQSHYSVLKQQLAAFPQWEGTLDKLVRNRDTAQENYSMFNEKLTDLTIREQAGHQSAHIKEVAQVPQHPVRPNKPVNIILSILLGSFLGLCLAVLQEYLDDRMNTAEQASRLLGASSLGGVPLITGSDARLLPQLSRGERAAESYRVLRTNIHFAAVDDPVKTLLVTSSNPGEGKSTTAANLACAMAIDGKKVILVDCDLRRASIHKLFGALSSPGVTDVLLGHSSLEDALQPYTELENLLLLTSGSTPPNPSELLNSRVFRNLVSELSQLADIVIFDSSPVSVSADAAILSSIVDGVVLVIEAGGTKKVAAYRSIQMLRQAHAKILGHVFNKLDLNNKSGYYYYRYNSNYGYNYNYNYSSMPPEQSNGALPGEGIKSLSAKMIDKPRDGEEK